MTTPAYGDPAASVPDAPAPEPEAPADLGAAVKLVAAATQQQTRAVFEQIAILNRLLAASGMEMVVDVRPRRAAREPS